MKKIFLTKRLLFLALIFSFTFISISFAQKVGYISSDVIRDKFVEAKQAELRVKSMVEDWKRELEGMEKQMEDLKFEIKKNRLIWSDEEKKSKDKELEDLLAKKMEFARRKFEAGGEYDGVVKQMMSPIEEKIYASVQEVASDEGYDVIWDKSQMPLAYSNAKYDLTVKVLRKLGVDVKALEKELQDKIDKDPRNQKKDTKTAPGKRTRDTDKIDSKSIDKTKTPPGGSPGSKPDIIRPNDKIKNTPPSGGGVIPITSDTNQQKLTPLK